MTYTFRIDISTPEAAAFLEYALTLPFVRLVEEEEEEEEQD